VPSPKAKSSPIIIPESPPVKKEKPKFVPVTTYKGAGEVDKAKGRLSIFQGKDWHLSKVKNGIKVYADNKNISIKKQKSMQEKLDHLLKLNARDNIDFMASI